MSAKPCVIIVDVRNGNVKSDGSNIDRPPEGQEAGLRSIETADVLVEVHPDGVYVKKGAMKGIVTMITTKSEAQMSLEKAVREKDARNADKGSDDLERGDHPLTKMNRVWDKDDPDYMESGGTVEGGLKGY